MGRVAVPLRQMGATMLARGGGKFPPLSIVGGNLRPIRYQMSVASAQVKSAVLLAGLFAGTRIADHPGTFWLPIADAAQVGRRLAREVFPVTSNG